VFGYLYDKESGKLIWQAKGTGGPSAPLQVPYDTTQGALQNAQNQVNAQLADSLTKVMFAGTERKVVVGNALMNLLSGPSGLPDLPKKAKKP
jgi:hypothetical protein